MHQHFTASLIRKTLFFCSYTLTATNNATDGDNGLPSITSEITINGNGATIERSSEGGTPGVFS